MFSRSGVYPEAELHLNCVQLVLTHPHWFCSGVADSFLAETPENQLVGLAVGATAGAVLTRGAVPCPMQQCMTSAFTSPPAFVFSRPFSRVCRIPELPLAVPVPRGGMQLEKLSSRDGKSAL